jgi:hypothetical protein
MSVNQTDMVHCMAQFPVVITKKNGVYSETKFERILSTIYGVLMSNVMNWGHEIWNKI